MAAITAPAGAGTTPTPSADREPDLVTIELVDGAALTLTPGRLDENARYAYRWGQCLAFALALHEVTGWPAQAAVDLADLTSWPSHYGTGAHWDETAGDVFITDPNELAVHGRVDAFLLDERAAHTVLVAPTGDLVDIRGVIPRTDWISTVTWDGSWRMGVDPAVLSTVVAERHGGPPQDLVLARSFIAPLLAQPDVAALLS